MSWVRPVLNHYLRLTEKTHLRRVRDPEHLRRSFLRKSRVFFHPPLGTRQQKRSLGPGEALHITPRHVSSQTVILYFHGGGYIFGAPETHGAMLAQLARKCGCRAILPRYPLAPEHPYPAAPDFAEATYQALLKDHRPEHVILGGDSAGGGLALALLARILRSGAPLPAGLFAFSPLTDLSFSGSSFAKNAETDVVLPADRAADMIGMYVGQGDAMHPDISPHFADFSGAPPIWITAGDTEILLDDSRRLVSRLQAEDVEVCYTEERDLPHVWPIFHNILPEARTTLHAVAEWINGQAVVSTPTR